MKARKASAALADLFLVLFLSMSQAADADIIEIPSGAALFGGTGGPLIVAGDPNGIPPDSPDNRVDPNTPTSPFSGVVSINIRFVEGGVAESFLCSGTLVASRYVVTAAHCLDVDGTGKLVDITQTGNDVRVAFNAGALGEPGRVNITASAVSMNPNFEGFGVCAFPESFLCINDDIAVITLGQDAPVEAKTYRVFSGDVTTGQLITMVGYGVSGNGVTGYDFVNYDADFHIKRSGQNVLDVFDRDDEKNFALASPQENWFADFDGLGKDLFCTTLGVCTQVLSNDKEAMIGPGDSGGAAFLFNGSEYFLMGDLTFERFGDPRGSFGSGMGGNLFSAYIDYLEGATGGVIETVSAIGTVPEPGTCTLMLIGLGLAGAATRRRGKLRKVKL